MENLIYACFRCNLYKGDYWAASTIIAAPRVFNPRLESRSDHFWLSVNGTIYPLTETGAFTIRRLRLNRTPLQAYRRKILQQNAERRIIEQMQETINLLAQTNEQQRHLLEEQGLMLEEQRRLLKILLDS